VEEGYDTDGRELRGGLCIKERGLKWDNLIFVRWDNWRIGKIYIPVDFRSSLIQA
jgi:hypothetical protein